MKGHQTEITGCEVRPDRMGMRDLHLPARYKGEKHMIRRKEMCLARCGEQQQAGTVVYQRDWKRPGVGNEERDVLFVLSGVRAILRIEDKQYYMQPFTFLMIPYENSISVETQGSTAYRYMQATLRADYLERLESIGLTLRETHTLAQPLVIEEIWKLLLATIDAVDPLSREMAEHGLALLMCLMREGSDGSVTRAAEVPHYDKLTALRHRIYSHPESSWFIQDICNELGISRPYFHKIYLAAFGTTCTQDVIASRIACSKRLLETSDEPIAAVSQKSGFETDVYFMRQFKRHVGMTPTAYRRIYRQAAADEKKDSGKKRR